MLGIRIRMFLGLPEPDSIVRGTDPDPAPDPEWIGGERTEIMLAK